MNPTENNVDPIRYHFFSILGNPTGKSSVQFIPYLLWLFFYHFLLLGGTQNKPHLEVNFSLLTCAFAASNPAIITCCLPSIRLFVDPSKSPTRYNNSASRYYPHGFNSFAGSGHHKTTHTVSAGGIPLTDMTIVNGQETDGVITSGTVASSENSQEENLKPLWNWKGGVMVTRDFSVINN